MGGANVVAAFPFVVSARPLQFLERGVPFPDAGGAPELRLVFSLHGLVCVTEHGLHGPGGIRALPVHEVADEAAQGCAVMPNSRSKTLDG